MGTVGEVAELGQLSVEFVECRLLGDSLVGDGIGRGCGYRLKSGGVLGIFPSPLPIGLAAFLLIGVDG